MFQEPSISNHFIDINVLVCPKNGITRTWKTEIDLDSTILSAEPHTNPGEEAHRRPVIEAYRKQAGTERKLAATQQQGSHSPETTLN